jgi:hypothetical protein
MEGVGYAHLVLSAFAAGGRGRAWRTRWISGGHRRRTLVSGLFVWLLSSVGVDARGFERGM